MKDLISTFSITEILVFTAGLILAIKGAWDLVDFFKNKYKERFNKDFDKKKTEETLQHHYADCIKQHEESVSLYNSLEHKIDDLSENINEKFDDLDARVDQLTRSDMHDIKQAITKDYHYFTEHQGWIDDFSLNCLEHRFNDYKIEGGNSFIESLMVELRNLPKRPPQ